MAKQILGKVVPITRGEYDSSTQYEMLDIVTYNGSSYIAKVSVRGQVPTNTSYWQLLAKQGDKPVYKVDYLTPTEMQAIVDEIIEDSTNAFNQDVEDKTNEFDGNAASKTNAFNNNAAQKATEFNNNASAKSNAFNQNAIEKSNAFNQNAQSKQDDFNTNATALTNDYNSNALAKTNAFDNNATAKQGAYDSNHTTKLGDYNDNAAAKKTAFDENADDKTQTFNDNVEDKTEEFNEYAGSFDRRITDNSNRIAHIESDLFDSGNASGSNIILNDSTLAEFKEIREDGVSEQTTTTGKNLYSTDNNDYIESNSYKIYNLNTGDDLLTISFEDNDTSVDISDCYLGFCATANPLDGYVWIIESGVVSSSNHNVTVYGNDPSKIGVNGSYIFVYPKTNTALNKLKQRYNIQVEIGSTATPYEPYTGGEPSPSPEYEQPITSLTGTHHINVCGKNLNSGLKTGYYRESDGAYISNTGYSCSINPIRVIAGNTYIYSIDGSTIRGYAYEYDINNNYIRRTAILDNGRYIPSSNVAYFHYSFSDGKIANIPLDAKVQIEIGTQATPYEPYVGTSTEITIPQGEFAGKINETYKDQIRLAYNETDGEYHAYLDKKIGKVVLDGSENWYKTGSYSFYTNITDINQTVTINKAKSNRFIYSNNWASSDETYRGKFNCFDGSQAKFMPTDNTIVEVAAFKSWLSTHNTEVYYLLATPYTIDLGVIEMPLTRYPITNMTTDSDLQPLLNVDYYRDFKATISTLQSNYTSLEARVSALEEA